MGSKKGGSQLAQLRSGLRDAGVTTSKPKKGRKEDRDDRVGQYRREQRKKRLDALMSSLNAFDERTARAKNDVLGRKVKGTTGRPGASKSEAIQLRREKLLPELEARHRSSSFVDRRFGEYNPHLSVEDKMLQRFTHERQNRTGKASLFDLNDDEEAGLTHYGQSLSGLDEMPDVMHEDDEEHGNMDAYETQGHFAGFAEGEGERSKNEVMKEIIAKSKLAKAERQKVKDADEEMRMELDEELGDIRSLLFSQKREEPEEEAPKAPAPDDKSEAYDAFVREMAFERRARPQDRLKTAEEIEEEQAKRLRDAEAARLRRMHGEPDEEEQDTHEEEEVTGRMRFGLGEGLEARGARAMQEDNEEEEGDEEGDEDEDEDEEDDDDDEDEDEEDVSDSDSDASLSRFERHLDAAEETAPGRHRALPKRAEVPTLPFTFPCPSTHDELLDLLEEHGVQPSQLHTVVSRIRTLHAPHLDEKNPERLQRLLGVLIDHLLYRASQAAGGDDTADVVVMNDLLLHIAELSKSYPARSAEHFVAKLAMMQRNLTRGLSRGALERTSHTWPALPELCLLRAAGIVWPTSDRWHPVATPLALLMAQYLAHARIRSLEDVAAALYLVSLLASDQRTSRRLVPEALNVLYSVVAILLPPLRAKGTAPAKALAEAFGIPTPDVGAPHTTALALREDAAPTTPVRLVPLLAHAPDTAQTRADLLGIAVQLLATWAQLYAPSPAFVELFTPAAFLLEVGAAHVRGTQPRIGALLGDAAHTLRAQLEHAVRERRALRLQAHRALSIASYAPKFDQQGFDPKRATDPDAERAQNAKLRALLKKERKGAIRELRKDAQFVAEAREQRRAEEDAAYKRKIDRITHGLQEERSEEKQLDRAKATLRKRAGKRAT
ncbi:nucleolar complex protein 14 [Malassezia brasiliensis]|uniref:Nucleolar complex protein 14 n=1 Tax=Malassezia brasiliensis TaxID=1821822 RepID=A0AAF0DWJ5_9BASI|nr:nucleolar complex protein 14 [Malassezia brasiliensis]